MLHFFSLKAIYESGVRSALYSAERFFRFAIYEVDGKQQFLTSGLGWMADDDVAGKRERSTKAFSSGER